MRQLRWFSIVFWLMLAQGSPGPQARGGGAQGDETDPHLMHTQREAIIKADHKKNVEDADALLKLAEELKADLEKDDAHVVSIKSMKKAEDIEKLAKSIHGRLKRF